MWKHKRTEKGLILDHELCLYNPSVTRHRGITVLCYIHANKAPRINKDEYVVSAAEEAEKVSQMDRHLFFFHVPAHRSP